MEWNNPTVKEHMVLPFGLTKALQAFLRLTAAIKGKMLSYLKFDIFCLKKLNWLIKKWREAHTLYCDFICYSIWSGKLNNLFSWAESILYYDIRSWQP